MNWMWAAVAVIVMVLTGAHVLASRGPTDRPILNRLWHICRFYVRIIHRPKVIGIENVPIPGGRDGSGVLLVANHTSGVDPALIQAFVPALIRWLMARDMMIGWMSWLWRTIEVIPVNRKGLDRTSARAAIRALQAGEIVGIFPQGGIAWANEPQRPFHPGVGLIARRSGAVIVPIYISNTPRTRHTFAALFCPSRSHLAFGKPLTLDQLHFNSDAELAQQLQQRVAETGHVFTSSSP